MTAAQTVEELVKSAQNNSVHAQLQLAEKYSRGDQVEQSNSEALYWYQQAAQNGSQVAALATGQAYLTGSGTNKDIENALFWLTKAAMLGDEQAPRLLGEVYEQLKQPTNNLDLAELWYQEAARNNPDAEQDYARVLEQQFNNRRAEQVATLDQLEEAFDAEQIELSPNAKSRSISQQDQNKWLYSLLTALIASLVGLVILLRRQQQLKANVHSSDSDQQRQQIKLERELKRKDDTLKQQKRQLETLYRHVKKLQANGKAPAPQMSYKDNPLNLACALFGFSPSQIPDEKNIKLRYKQLSKIYHPDLKGSEEEMKRLNQALKVILKHVNK
ncbi:J domain-containing protein [Vibrio sp. JPW-9-11-11]|uniref:J domain-containing protein n=1 Tax=Vibrio sp. JPW-9-11-11 TaxID=1416532 RepID=UPI0020CDFB16|nr:J domain-containing protein [Vibrio sp. JPW-9-11-11]